MTAEQRLAAARSGTLGTVTERNEPHLVPCCFVLIDETIYSAVDGKPKSTMALRRLDNIRAQPRASLLVDQFDEDWTQLWWIRVDGAARVVDSGTEHSAAIDALVSKYPQYETMRPTGSVIAIDIRSWRHWDASA
jgi:PPOX class probable F420-dependent enzyme